MGRRAARRRTAVEIAWGAHRRTRRQRQARRRLSPPLGAAAIGARNPRCPASRRRWDQRGQHRLRVGSRLPRRPASGAARFRLGLPREPGTALGRPGRGRRRHSRRRPHRPPHTVAGARPFRGGGAAGPRRPRPARRPLHGGRDRSLGPHLQPDGGGLGAGGAAAPRPHGRRRPRAADATEQHPRLRRGHARRGGRERTTPPSKSCTSRSRTSRASSKTCACLRWPKPVRSLFTPSPSVWTPCCNR